MLGLAVGLLVLVALVANAWRVVRWQRVNTAWDAYFARTLAERRAMRAEIARRGRFVLPVLTLLAPLLRRRAWSFRYQGIAAPLPACSSETFAFAHHYRPGPEDVFVATQMKCGTSWMQQVVYEAVCRGKGDLGDGGHRHLYAMSPWIESHASVRLRDAPLVGERPVRIVKTHLPTVLCPYDARARFVYVLRHPVSCFASCVDFLQAGVGPLCLPRPQLLDWFCSDEMWWGPWPDHAEGWWRWSRERENVLFVHYEDMKRDLSGCVREVSDFLRLDLDPAEVARVTEKASFAWMKEREECFEMHPPSVLSKGSGSFLASGASDRHRDARDAESARIARFCRERLTGAAYPLARFYPDVAERGG